MHLVQNVSNQDVQIEFYSAEAARKVMRIRSWVGRFHLFFFFTTATGSHASTATVALGIDLGQACWLVGGGGE